MEEPNKILAKMLDRLLAGLVNGPSLNCRPYASRQRLDLVQLGKLGDAAPEDILRDLLADSQNALIKARVPMPKGNGNGWEKPRKLRVAASIEAADEHGIPLADGPIESDAGEAAKSPERDWLEQQAVLNKLHTIAEDARTYEQDTGVSVLNIGFPLLSLPAGTFGGANSTATRRVLAPLAFIPVSITVKRGAAPAIELACKGEGVDRVMPNTALVAWLEQQTGKPPIENDEDEEGIHPWEEICGIVRGVCAAMDIAVPEGFEEPPARDEPDAPSPGGKPRASFSATTASEDGGPDPVDCDDGENDESSDGSQLSPKARSKTTSPTKLSDQESKHVAFPADLRLEAAPKSDAAQDVPCILCSAVLGLFPLANQGLLRDTQAMLAEEKLSGPVESFIRLGVSLDARPVIAAPEAPAAPPASGARAVCVADERFVTGSDPCQARAVRLARECQGLVVHGPPGTGKSQTITNIIGDHLARGERVLVVCDKRTALDVVFNRLSHMGLGNLCALVHDPRRDQRELYKSIRQQLDELPEAKANTRSSGALAKLNVELQSLHDELSRYRNSLTHRQAPHGLNFHELVGQWLALSDAAGSDAAIADVALEALDAHAATLIDVLKRGETANFGVNPWASAAGVVLSDFLARPMDKIRSAVTACEESARAADAAIDPRVPAFSPTAPLSEQSKARTRLADNLARVIETAEPAILARWAGESAEALTAGRRKLAEADAFIQSFRAGPLDAELLAAVRNRELEALPIAEQLAKLAAYQQLAGKWYAFLPLRAKSEAAAVVNAYGLTLNIQNALRAQKFLIGLRARIELSALNRLLAMTVADKGLVADEILERSLTGHRATIDLILTAHSDSALAGLAERVAAVLKQPAGAAELIEGLRISPPRAAALEQLEAVAGRTQLFGSDWLSRQFAQFRVGQPALAVFSPLRERVETLEGVLRVRQGLTTLPAELRSAVEKLLQASIGAKSAEGILRREALAAEISRRLKADAHLQEIDAHRLQAAFDRYRELDQQKRELTRAAILHQWTSRQQERLLAQSGSRLNSLGADLRRRLVIRGERAMRLRQVVAVGAKIDGGDPLFDLCPIWLCSPETVAQIFPRQAVFDVLVFDEASQLRLEESLPVLVRGKRVVIAGDPKQLPPTRFFESAVAASEDDDAQTDQDLFEQQQGEVEDLLAAALGLDIQQCYLDVHYRSRHADLIAFSNEHFYGSRLQPIPGHPSADHDPLPPVELEQVAGIYHRRRNEVEAERIVQTVKELLARKDPPSIGIACFNLVQRDLVVEKLEDLAAEDAKFAKQLEKARARQGARSFEGLFVKNLENVQGDERDYILISTTYGPDASGKFYRRFGPLGRAGGGRRLNVLITRAREKVHVITSIPPEAYRSLPQPEEGQTPGGAWLLFAYLKFAEQLRQVSGSESAPAIETASGAEPAAAPPAVNILPAKVPSAFAEALARRLASEHVVGSDVYWGNEGFCVDLALHDPRKPGEVTIGVLCDAARFTAAEDPMQWDIFRTGILEGQGWTLHRLWTPHFFRDPKGVTRSIIAEAAR